MLALLMAGLPAMMSFLGGATARAVIGHAINWFEQAQNHVQEMEKMRLEADLADRASARQNEAIRLQAELKVSEIKIAGEQAIDLEGAKAFTEAMKVANAPTGVKWIDGWNGSIRPLAATIAITIWLLKIIKAALVITAWDENLLASILGYYFADRHLGKRGR